MSIRDETIAGIGWVALARAFREILIFATEIALARMLLPEAYGLLGMVVVFSGFAQLFSNPGFDDALVQNQDLEERHLSSVFWVNAAMGVALTAVFAACAPFVAEFYGEPRLTPIAMVVAANFTLNPLNLVHAALIQKRMDFKLLTVVRVVASTVTGGAALLMAFTGWGVWALVVRLVGGTLMRVVMMWAVVDWRPRAIFDWSAVTDLLGYSSNLLGFRVLNYWVRQADDLLVGRYVGSHGLGIYRKAYEVMLQPINHLRSVIGEVAFPAFAKIQEDRQRLKQAYLYATRALGLPSIPMMCIVFVVADPLVVGIFGEHWAEVGPVLQILCLVGVKQPVSSTTGWLYKACGRTDWQFRWSLFGSATALAAFVIGIQWGVIGVATAYAIRGYVVWYPGMAIPGKLIDMSFWEFLKNQAPVFLCSVAAAAPTWIVKTYLLGHWGPWPQLGVLVPGSIGLFLLLVWGFDVRAYREVRDIAVEQWREKFGDDGADGDVE